MQVRIEEDSIGRVEIPAKALYGIHAARARENFPDGSRFHPEWYKAMGLVKKACYITAESYHQALNRKLNEGTFSIPAEQQAITTFPPSLFSHLSHAAGEVADGSHFDDFIVPSLSGGAGTSINMNVNEIIANLALVAMGEKPGRYSLVDPLLHANIFQSTNDVVPTALRVATMFLLNDLEKEINDLRFVIEQIETAHQGSLRVGYTQMQEAVPTSFGKLFSTYSDALSRDWWRVSRCFERIKTVNLGGSAIGTGMAVPRYFIMEAAGQLQKLTGLPVTRSENLADATANLDAFVEVHAILKAHAVNLEKMVSDLRLLASDLVSSSNPQLSIPAAQVGSSIMPGKINPVIPEFIISAAHRIYANDQLIGSLCGQGCLELNAYLPAIGHALLESVKLLIACDSAARMRLVQGLTVAVTATREQLLRSPAVTTALLPVNGYHRASDLARRMKEHRVDIVEANSKQGLLPEDRLLGLLQPDQLLKLGYTMSDLS